MKNKKLLTLFLSGVLLLSGCSEGTAVTSSVSSIPSEAPASPGSVSANQPSSSSRLEDKLVSGGVYQVENWSLSDSPQAVGISLEEMDPIVEENDYKNMDHLLLVTMQYTAAPNIDGELLSTFLANNFSPMTESNLSAMEELMKKKKDDDQYPPLYGSDAVYLDKGNGKRGDQNYFEINSPENGKSVTYTLAYHLTDDEYQAAQNGQLYLYAMIDSTDDPMANNAPKTIHLSQDLKKEA